MLLIPFLTNQFLLPSELESISGKNLLYLDLDASSINTQQRDTGKAKILTNTEGKRHRGNILHPPLRFGSGMASPLSKCGSNRNRNEEKETEST
jgi:hypothetical protein